MKTLQLSWPSLPCVKLILISGQQNPEHKSRLLLTVTSPVGRHTAVPLWADRSAGTPRIAASDRPAALAELQLTGFGLVL